MPEKEPQITVIGGGTGSFTLLSELKQHTSEITALANMADNGGSTGELRDELGVLPPGDLRQCLVALSTDTEEWREQFNFRFEEGKYKGLVWGNFFLSGIEHRTGSITKAIEMASKSLNVQGRVMPSTLDNCQLVMRTEGKTIYGESNIGATSLPAKVRPELALEPKADLNDEAKEAIENSNLIVIAPGDLYQSLAPALLVEGMSEALMTTEAEIVYVSNLVNKPHHTAEFAVHDYASEIERFAGGAVLDYVLYNTDEPTKYQVKKYARDEEYPVVIDTNGLDRASYTAIGGSFLSHAHREQNKGDNIERSLIRHDGVAVAAALVELTKK